MLPETGETLPNTGATLPEAVVFLDVLVELWNDSILSLPCCLIIWQISPLDEVP